MPNSAQSIGVFKNIQEQGYILENAESLPDKIAIIISNILGFFTLIAGFAFLFYFIIGAINWIVSAGDPQKIQTSRQMIINAIIGLIITVIAYPAILIITRLLGIPMADPAEIINQLQYNN